MRDGCAKRIPIVPRLTATVTQRRHLALVAKTQTARKCPRAGAPTSGSLRFDHVANGVAGQVGSVSCIQRCHWITSTRADAGAKAAEPSAMSQGAPAHIRLIGHSESVKKF